MPIAPVARKSLANQFALSWNELESSRTDAPRAGKATANASRVSEPDHHRQMSKPKQNGNTTIAQNSAVPETLEGTHPVRTERASTTNHLIAGACIGCLTTKLSHAGAEV